jgi:hypothetical protein
MNIILVKLSKDIDLWVFDRMLLDRVRLQIVKVLKFLVAGFAFVRVLVPKNMEFETFQSRQLFHAVIASELFFRASLIIIFFVMFLTSFVNFVDCAFKVQVCFEQNHVLWNI